jgi:hypothetical protein
MWCNAAWLAYPEFRDDPVGRVHSAPVDLDAFADGLATLMEHLIKKRGYTCIKWLCINNEPGANFSWWQAPPNKPLSIGPGLAAVRKALDQRGLKLPLSGPDTTTAFPSQAPGDLDYLGLGAYDFHDYGADFDFRTKGIYRRRSKTPLNGRLSPQRRQTALSLSSDGVRLGARQTGCAARRPCSPAAVVRLANGVAAQPLEFPEPGDLDGQWLVDTWDQARSCWRSSGHIPIATSVWVCSAASRHSIPRFSPAAWMAVDSTIGNACLPPPSAVRPGS